MQLNDWWVDGGEGRGEGAAAPALKLAFFTGAPFMYENGPPVYENGPPVKFARFEAKIMSGRTAFRA